jgi:hypothetical protein
VCYNSQGWTGTSHTAAATAAAMITTAATQYHISDTQAVAAASNRHSSSIVVFTATQCSQQQQQQLLQDALTADCFDSHRAQYISEMKQTIALMPAANVSTFAQVRINHHVMY